MSKEDFDAHINEKMDSTKSLLRSYDRALREDKNTLAKNYQVVAMVNNYISDYVAVTRIRDKETGKLIKLQPVLNRLVLISEERAFDVQQLDYADRFTVFNSVKGRDINSIDENVVKIAEDINQLRSFQKKIKAIVDFSELDEVSEKDTLDLLELVPGKYKDYYILLGPSKIKSCSYQESKILKEWRKLVSKSNGGDELKDNEVEKLLSMFEVGKRYINKDIKFALNNLYKELGYNKKAKTTDLDLYFVTKQILTPDKKHGVEILGRR